ncbi:MAG TPA: DUF2277 domain-containing protein [Anaerolineae bacterium]
MCRSIKRLRNADQLATDEEIAAAALQFVRKVSGYRAPSRANQAAFDHAVADIAASTRVLLKNLEPRRHIPALAGGAREDSK